ncbi:MAG: mechanosensitive ion channel [Bryobacterales bacterium]|nr:mechanosensitive ion channel [Bryobacterales bacterium]
MDILGIEFRADILLGWFDSAVSYIAIRWRPSLAIVFLALVLYWAFGWILRLVQRRFAAKTETTIDDELVRFIRKALRLTLLAWALWQLMGLWVPLLGEQTRDGEWVPYETQPREWVWGIWIALVFIPLSRFVRHLMQGFESKLLARSSTTGLDETALPMVNRFIRTAVIVIGVLIAMPHLGIEIAPLLAGAGVVGLALSLAAKDTLSNLMAGVLLIMDRPFQVGDRIELWSAPRETGTWGQGDSFLRGQS